MSNVTNAIVVAAALSVIVEAMSYALGAHRIRTVALGRLRTVIYARCVTAAAMAALLATALIEGYPDVATMSSLWLAILVLLITSSVSAHRRRTLEAGLAEANERMPRD